MTGLDTRRSCRIGKSTFHSAVLYKSQCMSWWYSLSFVDHLVKRSDLVVIMELKEQKYKMLLHCEWKMMLM